jgi:hypothetical protein
VDIIAPQSVLCLDEAPLGRRLVTRIALLAFLAGVLFLIGVLASQPAHAAVAGGTPGAGAGVTAATGTAAGVATRAVPAASNAAGTVTAVASGAATAAGGAASQVTTVTGQAADAVVQTASGAARTVAGAVGSVGRAVGTVTGASGGIVPVGASPGSPPPGPGGGSPKPPGGHHHRTGHTRRRHRPDGRADSRGRPATAVASWADNGTPARLLAGSLTSSLRAAAGLPQKPGGPVTPGPAFPAPLPNESASGSAGGASTHAAAGLQAFAAVAAGAAATTPARYRQGWTALIRDGRGPHRPG